jgi:predicted metal-dependent hydrolase
MNPKKLQQMAYDICNRFNYPFPKSLTLNRRLRTTLGRCTADKRIELNEWVVLHNNEKIISALLKHEIVHLRHFNHNKEFMQAVKIIGSAKYIDDLFPDMILRQKCID